MTHITPSWQDVAERWQRAYEDAQAKLDAVADYCRTTRASGDESNWTQDIEAIIEGES